MAQGPTASRMRRGTASGMKTDRARRREQHERRGVSEIPPGLADKHRKERALGATPIRTSPISRREGRERDHPGDGDDRRPED